MRLSLRAIQLCQMKFGKGRFYGFEQMDEADLEHISEEDAKQDFNELIQNGIIDTSNDSIHISALGQHIFNMMLEPEQYIILDNKASNVCIRVYIRNTYYLCIIENKKVKTDYDYDRYILELLPTLELVIGAFTYALQDNDVKQTQQDIRIEGKAWKKDRKNCSEIEICGKYENEKIYGQIVEQKEDAENRKSEFESEISELINQLTVWMFGNILAMNEKEGD